LAALPLRESARRCYEIVNAKVPHARLGVSRSRKEPAWPPRWRNAAPMRSLGPLFWRGFVVSDTGRTAYWDKTRNLMLVVLGLWFVFSFLVHMFVGQLNNVVILGFPLGFYMAAQGSLIAFVVMLFWFAGKQNRIDEEHGMAED
jgi:putative solute:sodium symporter small subunit